MRWNTKHTLKSQNPEQRQSEIIETILKNRDIKNQEKFFNPPHPSTYSLKQIGIDPQQADKAIQRIKKAIKDQEQIIVYGDYDADGITATAIMWETLHHLGAQVMPHIPDRFTEGYGMKINTIKTLKSQFSTFNLIITVDQGITAHDAVKYCNSQNIDVIITDHHQPDKTLPPAHAIIHSTQTSGSAVAYWFCNELKTQSSKFKKSDVRSQMSDVDNRLDLPTIGTVADLLPLTGINRSLIYHGLPILAQTARPGLQQLFQTAAINPDEIQSWHIGYLIAPRINAMGRLEHALDSLRLLCTTDTYRANQLAQILHHTNQERQSLTQQMTEHALQQAQQQTNQNIIILGHSDYPEGIIGLIAGKLVEKYSKPAIVFSHSDKDQSSQATSKASARSIPNYNIIEAIRTAKDYLISAGGHPMAAGLSIQQDKLDKFTRLLIDHAQRNITAKDMVKTLHIDTQIRLADITSGLYQQIQNFAPFGIGNFEPFFSTTNVNVQSFRAIGKQQQHLKLTISEQDQNFTAIAFNQAHHLPNLKPGQTINIAYNITENNWNGRTNLELKIKDIKFK